MPAGSCGKDTGIGGVLALLRGWVELAAGTGLVEKRPATAAWFDRLTMSGSRGWFDRLTMSGWRGWFESVVVVEWALTVNPALVGVQGHSCAFR